MTNKLAKPAIDLNTANPQGRVDVLAYKFAERLARLAEAKYGLSGIWDSVKPHVHEAVVGSISGLEIPPVAKVILTLITTNMGGMGKVEQVNGR